MPESLREVSQNKHSVNVPREGLFHKVIQCEFLSLKDHRVFLYLLTVLDGWSSNRALSVYAKTSDPMNFKAVDIDKVAEALNLEKKEVKKSLKHLLEQQIIEKGESKVVRKGYRFTF